MSMFSRFFGNKDDEQNSGDALVANAAIKDPLSLQVLFREAPGLDASKLTEGLRSYDPSMAKARCEIDSELNQEGNMVGLMGWKRHVIRFVGFNLPMPAEAVDACVAPAHYPQEFKEQARAHQAHLILYYGGYEESPLEQYVALAAVAGVLANFGAIVVLNESGHTSFPAGALAAEEAEGDMM